MLGWDGVGWGERKCMCGVNDVKVGWGGVSAVVSVV